MAVEARTKMVAWSAVAPLTNRVTPPLVLSAVEPRLVMVA